MPRAPDTVSVPPDSVCELWPLDTVIVPGLLEDTVTPPAPSSICSEFTPLEMVTLCGVGDAIG